MAALTTGLHLTVPMELLKLALMTKLPKKLTGTALASGTMLNSTLKLNRPAQNTTYATQKRSRIYRQRHSI